MEEINRNKSIFYSNNSPCKPIMMINWCFNVFVQMQKQKVSSQQQITTLNICWFGSNQQYLMQGPIQTITPRILKDHFRSHDGIVVLLVGKIISINNAAHTLTLEVSQQKNTIVQAKIDGNYIDIKQFQSIQDEYIQVTGIVCNQQGSINVKQYCRFGRDFDLKTYNELVSLSNQQFKNLFRPS